MSYEEDDCVVCKKENAAIQLFPSDTDHDYRKVCSDRCYQAFSENTAEVYGY